MPSTRAACVTLGGCATSGTAPYSYAWDLDGDGAYDDATGAAPAFTPADDGPASLPVAVRVTDAAGTTDTDTTSVVVGNVAPTATLAADPAAITEGDPFTVSLTSTADPSATARPPASRTASTAAMGCSATDGTSASADCDALDDGPAVLVRAEIRDRDLDARGYSTTISVANGAPTGTFGASSPIDEGDSSALAWTDATDPSAADATQLHFAFACVDDLAALTARGRSRAPRRRRPARSMTARSACSAGSSTRAMRARRRAQWSS